MTVSERIGKRRSNWRPILTVVVECVLGLIAPLRDGQHMLRPTELLRLTYFVILPKAYESETDSQHTSMAE